MVFQFLALITCTVTFIKTCFINPFTAKSTYRRPPDIICVGHTCVSGHIRTYRIFTNHCTRWNYHFSCHSERFKAILYGGSCSINQCCLYRVRQNKWSDLEFEYLDGGRGRLVHQLLCFSNQHSLDRCTLQFCCGANLKNNHLVLITQTSFWCHSKNAGHHAMCEGAEQSIRD